MTGEELTAKLESAIDGSRELDANIAAHIAQHAGAYYVTNGDRASDEMAGEWLILSRTDDRHVATRRPPAYTTSVDAALTLIPLGMGWELQFQRDDHVYLAAVGSEANPESGRFDRHQTQARTAALALCGAAVKARVGT